MSSNFHCYRPANFEEYEQMAARFCAAISANVPPGSTAAVISRGDDQLLAAPEVSLSHFPQSEGGTYAGFYPADGQIATQMVKELVTSGVEFLAIPATALWWLEFYGDLSTYLSTQAELVFRSSNAGVVYRLGEVVSEDFSDQLPPVEQARQLIESLLPPYAPLAIACEPGMPLPRGNLTTVGTVHTDIQATTTEGAVEALKQVEDLRTRGAEFLIIFHDSTQSGARPEPLISEASDRYKTLLSQRYVCSIFDIGQPSLATVGP